MSTPWYVWRMTIYIHDAAIDAGVMHGRGDRAAAALVAATVERLLKRDTDRAELRGEAIAWGTLDIRVRPHATAPGYIVRTSAQDTRHGAPTRQLAAFEEQDTRVLAAEGNADAARRAVLAMGQRLDAVAALIRRLPPSPLTGQIDAAIRGESWESPSADAGRAWRGRDDPV